MNMEQLRYFIAVSDTLHMTNAADEMNISEAAMSKAISRLENEIGYDLFVRKGRSINLNANGEQFLPFAKAAVDNIEKGLDALGNISHRTENSVTLQSIPLILFPGLMQKLISVCPDIAFPASLGVSSSELEENLLSHKTDLCISSRTIKNAQISKTLIMREPLFLILSTDHPLSKKKFVCARDLKSENFLMSIQHSGINRYCEIVFSNDNINPPKYTISNINEGLEHISMNRCVAIMPHTIYQDLLRRQTPGTTAISILNDNMEPFYFDQYLYYRKKNNSSKASEVRKILLEYFSSYAQK